MKINISNKMFYSLIVIVFALGLVIGAYAIAGTIDPSKGFHLADQISVNIPGVGEKTLQQAINEELIAGSAPEITCDFNGLWVYWDDTEGGDFGVVCQGGKVVKWCNYAEGNEGRGLHQGQYDC